jgi:hypothetical protein
MTEWLFTRKAWIIGGCILAVVSAFAVVFRDAAPLANITSIVGLAVSILGFIVTIWTVIDARQQIKDAADRAEKAIAKAGAEARRAVAGIATQLRSADCAALRRAIEDLRQAALDRKWPRTIVRCQESRPVVLRLAQDSNMTEEEASKLRGAADDLRLVQRFIESTRPSAQSGSLEDSHLETLDNMIDLLSKLQARFHHESLGVIEERIG